MLESGFEIYIDEIVPHQVTIGQPWEIKATIHQVANTQKRARIEINQVELTCLSIT